MTSCLADLLGGAPDQDVCDWGEDELHEESNESHEAKPDAGGQRDLLELFAVRLGALAKQTVAGGEEVLQRLDSLLNLIHCCVARSPVLCVDTCLLYTSPSPRDS
eukprot:TRINITY_DN6525_c0_g1_i1.p1 TRINITY_DN6525_c0_g1~~TRINITY_DN6525_c0_g1_i1.p1  ORF type:complete len:105 (+),score=16.51 TRINITY_DN6525_c0_g1_i1:540-854(+)